jgi:hypothetical protein
MSKYLQMVAAVQESPIGVLEGIAGDLNGASGLALLPDKSERAIVGAVAGPTIARCTTIVSLCNDLIAACLEHPDGAAVSDLAQVRPSTQFPTLTLRLDTAQCPLGSL